MFSVPLRDPALLALGLFHDCRLDPNTGNLAADGTPALVADADVASGAAYNASACPGATLSAGWTTFGGADDYSTGVLGGNPFGLTAMGGAQPWQAASTTYYATSTPGATWTLVTSAYRVDLFWITTSPGALAHLTIDGQPAKGWDTSAAGPQPRTIQLDGQQHTIVVECVGDAVLGQPLLGAVVDTSGTGLAAALGVQRNGQATQAVTWTVQATSTSQVEVKNGSTVIGTLNVGQASDALIPGFTLSLKAGSWGGTNVATVTTLAATLTLSNVVLYSALATDATYTSPVLDSGTAGSAWPLLECTQGPLGEPLAAVQFGIGESPAPDDSWTWTTLAATAVDDPDGNPWRRVVYAGNGARGRYAQAVGAISDTARVWVSDLRAYCWLPEQDDFLALLPKPVYSGQRVTLPLLTALAALWAYVGEQADALLDGANFTTAAGSYLSAYGEEFALPRLPGEGDAAYRARLSTLFSGRATTYQPGQLVGGSRPFLQAVLSGALGTPVTVAQLARRGQQFVLGSTDLPAPLGATAQGYWRWQVQAPFAGLQIAPETARQVITDLRPVGSIVSILWT